MCQLEVCAMLKQAHDVVQGYMSGKDFARSVVCSVHTNQIEDYLSKVDALPAQLADAQVCITDINCDTLLFICTACALTSR